MATPTRACALLETWRMPESRLLLPEELSFILCEGIREEARGKLSLLGVFPGNEIVVSHASETRLRICFYWATWVVLDATRARLQVLGPMGEQVLDVDGGDPLADASVFAFIGIMNPARPGTFTARLILGNETFERPFVIKEGPEFSCRSGR